MIFNEGDEHIHALLWEIRGDIQTFITVNTYLLERALHYPIQAVPYSDVFVTSFDAYICVFSLQRSRDPSCATFIVCIFIFTGFVNVKLTKLYYRKDTKEGKSILINYTQ